MSARLRHARWVVPMLCGLVLVVGGYWALSSHEPTIAIVTPRYKTVEERRETLSAMREAWRNRPRTGSEACEIAERAFIFHVNAFVVHVEGEEIFPDAGVFLIECYREYKAQFGDPSFRQIRREKRKAKTEA